MGQGKGIFLTEEVVMDLRSEYPRSVCVKLGGYVHLARMIDKCRAKVAGTLGEYIYPCPMDQRLLDFAGISGDDFLGAVTSKTDQDVAAWFQATASSHTDEEVDTWNVSHLNRGPDTDEKRAFFQEIRDGIDPTRVDVTTWADLLDLEEGRRVPLRSHSL